MGLEDTLTELFHVREQRARFAASRMSEEEFEASLQQLEATIGEDRAWEVVKEGKFLDYTNGDVQLYLAKAREVEAVADEHFDRLGTHVFHSIASLTDFLETEAKEKRPAYERLTNAHLGKYKILQRDDDMARGYLAALCKDGEVTVGDHEHWNNSNRESGPRGNNIIRKIYQQINNIFHDLGLQRPNQTLNHGQQKLSISPQTRRHLDAIRDRAYALQAEKD